MLTKKEHEYALGLAKAAADSIGVVAFAELIGIHNVHVYHALKSGHVSKTFETGLRNADFLENKKRVRMVGEVYTDKRRKDLQLWATSQGFGSWGGLCNYLADCLEDGFDISISIGET